MTLKVWLFCSLVSVGWLIGFLLFELQTEALWRAAVGKAFCVFAGSAITAFYFTRPGFLEKLKS
ncbi:hypothetical protein ACEOVB_29585 [Pseudomonas aeruginosa]